MEEKVNKKVTEYINALLKKSANDITVQEIEFLMKSVSNKPAEIVNSVLR